MKSTKKNQKPQLPDIRFLLLVNAFLIIDLLGGHPWGAIAAIVLLFLTGILVGYRN